MYKILSICFIAALILAGCGTRTPYYSFEKSTWEENSPPDSIRLTRQVILVGNTGDPSDEFRNLLRAHLALEQESEQKATLIFLGDNLYETGLPPQDASGREEAESRLNTQLSLVKDYEGRVFFVPGDKDWNNDQEGGYRAIRRQAGYINEYAGNGKTMLPSNGCPGPEEVILGDGVVLILIDSEWYLHNEFKPAYPECNIESEWDFFYEFRRMVRRHEGKHILVAMHHPLYSNGNRGGHYDAGDHLFPLTLERGDLWVPLPVVGSFYTLLRKYGINSQDIPNEKYQMLKKGLEESVYEMKSVTFAAAHDQILQHTQVEGINHIISGTGSRVNYARKGKNAAFVNSSTGLARVDYYENGEAWLSFFVPDAKDSLGKRVYRTPLYALVPEESSLASTVREDLDYSDSVKQIVAGEEYRSGKFSSWIFGKHYRKEWATPVTVPYLDIPNYGGGLTPLKQGGGKQTISLRVMDKDSIQYNIRSINKNPIGAVPEPFRFTFAQDLVKDQISTAHPYGAFTVAPMADAIGMYHTDPKLVYVPFAPQLGEFLGTFGGMNALFEIRPDEDLSNFERFGYSKNVVGTERMLEQLNEDNDDSVDDEMFLKARLFDMLIGDWDRHEDQWRWAEYDKPDKGELFRPVPRDRDQVYTLYDGIFPWLASRKWAVRNLQHFDNEITDVEGMMMSGNSLDRRLLQGLEREEWQQVVRDMQANLTDSLIEYAIRQMPEEVFPVSGPQIIEKLKARRDDLEEYAMEYYEFLAKEPDVVASDKHELIKVGQRQDGEVTVTILKREKEGDVEHVRFQRSFIPAETEEIRLYTLAGEDSIVIDKSFTSPIRLRIILGKDEKYVENNAASGKVDLYAKKSHDHTFTGNGRLKTHTSTADYINSYDPEMNQYDYLGPRISFQFNRDNGLFVGAGARWRTHGFQHKDFESEQDIYGNYSFATSAFNLMYTGRFSDVFGQNNDLVLSSHYYSPQNIFNFFGRGNGSENEENISFYRLDMKGFSQEITLDRVPSENLHFGITAGYDYMELSRNQGGIIEEYNNPSELNAGQFISLGAYLNLERTNYNLYPFNGIRWENSVEVARDVKNSLNFGKVKSAFSVYLTPDLPMYLTLAMRFGTEATFGEFPFYQGSFLGGVNSLRGYRMQRFNGDISVYQNTELRLAVSEIKSYVFNGYWGVFGFIDHGRVWTRDLENESAQWHRGYGPGLWLNLFKVFVTSAGVGFSDEGRYFYLRAGMYF